MHACVVCTYASQGCVRSRQFVSIYLYVCQQKQAVKYLTARKFPAKCKVLLSLEFKCLQCGLPCPVSCTDRAIHAVLNFK